MRTQAPATQAERAKAARAPLTLEAAAEQLSSDLGVPVSRDMIKALAKGSKVTLYKVGASRLVQRDELARLSGYLAEKLALDREWLRTFCVRVRGVGGAARRMVVHAPPSRPTKVATIAGAPRPQPARVVARGQR